MATLNSTQFAQIQPPTYAPLKPNEREGRKRVLFAEIVFSGALNGDTIQWFKLPHGARVTGGRLIGNANGTSVTFTLGDQGNANTGVSANTSRYLAATSYAAAATTEVANTYALVAGYEVNGETIVVSIIGGANPTNATKLMCILEYVVD